MTLPIRVAYYGQPPHQAPWVYPCGVQTYSNKANVRKAHQCLYPGLNVEIVNAIFHTVQRPTVFENVGRLTLDRPELTASTADVVGMVLPLDYLNQQNYTATWPVLYDSLSILTTSRPVSQNSYVFYFINSFTPMVWLTIVLLAVIRKVLQGNHVAMEVRSYRYAFSTFLFPITLCFMLLTGLYRSKLVANLLVDKITYPINSIEDVANLPSDVRILGFGPIWSKIVESSSGELHNKLKQKPLPISSPLDIRSIREIEAKRAVFVGTHLAVSYILNTYRRFEIREVALNDQLSMALGVTQRCDPHILADLNVAIISLRGLINGMKEWYLNYQPRQTIDFGVDYVVPQNHLILSARAFRGCFGGLFTGILVGSVAMIVEVLVAKRTNMDPYYFHY